MLRGPAPAGANAVPAANAANADPESGATFVPLPPFAQAGVAIPAQALNNQVAQSLGVPLGPPPKRRETASGRAAPPTAMDTTAEPS